MVYIIFKGYLVFYNIDKLLLIQQMPIVRLRLALTFSIRNNNCIMNIIVQKSSCVSAVASLGFIPRSDLLGQRIWMKLGDIDHKITFHVGFTFSINVSVSILWRWACALLTSKTTVGMTIFKKILSNLLGHKWYYLLLSIEYIWLIVGNNIFYIFIDFILLLWIICLCPLYIFVFFLNHRSSLYLKNSSRTILMNILLLVFHLLLKFYHF